MNAVQHEPPGVPTGSASMPACTKNAYAEYSVGHARRGIRDGGGAGQVVPLDLILFAGIDGKADQHSGEVRVAVGAAEIRVVVSVRHRRREAIDLDGALSGLRIEPQGLASREGDAEIGAVLVPVSIQTHFTSIAAAASLERRTSVEVVPRTSMSGKTRRLPFCVVFVTFGAA